MDTQTALSAKIKIKEMIGAESPCFSYKLRKKTLEDAFRNLTCQALFLIKNLIENGSKVKYDANKNVLLKIGFKAEQGTVLKYFLTVVEDRVKS